MQSQAQTQCFSGISKVIFYSFVLLSSFAILYKVLNENVKVSLVDSGLVFKDLVLVW